MARNNTVILADDHPLMRKGLRELVEENGLFSVAGEAGDGERALELIEEKKPSIAVLDIDMPKMNGLDVALTVQKRKIPVDIILLTMYDKESIFNKAMESGVMGYVMKDSAATEILEALKTVSSGKHYISPALSSLLVKRSGEFRKASDEKIGISNLTGTERKILRMIAENKSSKEIGEELFISPRTVDTHRNNICQKLDIHGATALLRFALEHKSLL